MKVTCPECGQLPYHKCLVDGFPLPVCHEARFQQALLQNTRHVEDRTMPVLMVRCPHCGAMPRRNCTGPAPFRDPKPTHKARYLAAQAVDNTVRRARGSPKRVDLSELPFEERPWYGNERMLGAGQIPVQKLGRREMQRLKHAREAAARERDKILEALREKEDPPP